MNIKRIGKTSAQIVKTEQGEILFSYETPVAARLLSSQGMVYYKTDKFHSVTTSKHINKFIHKDLPVQVMDQSFFDDLVKITLTVKI